MIMDDEAAYPHVSLESDDISVANARWSPQALLSERKKLEKINVPPFSLEDAAKID